MLKVIGQRFRPGLRANGETLFRSQREMAVPMPQEQGVMLLNKAVPPGIAHRPGHARPNLVERGLGGVAKAHRGEVARANFALRINEQVLGAGAAAEQLGAFDAVERADLGPASPAIGTDVELAEYLRCGPG